MMKELVFATNNQNKVFEIKSLFKNLPYNIMSLKDINCVEEIPEPFETLKENAMAKAKFVYNKFNLNCFADDTGLEIYALDGKPGVYSARYAGKPPNSEKNMAKVLEDLKGENNRAAQFKTIIALILNGKDYYFEGIVKGEITNERIGVKGFGYDPIFLPYGKTMTFAEMPVEDKNKISHRARAIDKLAGFLKLQST
ncbi:non-canonical purine NTP diphosphatase [Hyphobacterium sp. CCMP332]|nr:non-canonical purine NTP diphosphatase [Hyphobacterium sp. CCMP332]